MKRLIFTLGLTNLIALGSLFTPPALGEASGMDGDKNFPHLPTSSPPHPLWLLSSAVRRVTVSQSHSTSTPQDEPILIELAPGYGVNISFIPTGEVIEKVWLDNPSFVTLDVDGCLSGLGEGDCERNEATVVHLRRIERLEIPGLLPTDSTLLTVVTRSPTGRQFYLFQVAPAQSPNHLVIEFAPPSVKPDLILIEAISRGVQRALTENLLSDGSPLQGRLENFINLLRSGVELSTAAREAGISMALVERLQAMGNYINPATLLETNLVDEVNEAEK